MASGVEELLDMLFEMVDEAKNMPLSSDKCVLERDRALDLIDDIRAQFPVELGEAKKLVASRNDYIAAAKREAEVIRKQAEAEAQRMLAEESVLNQAKQRSAELMRQAEERSREYSLSSRFWIFPSSMGRPAAAERMCRSSSSSEQPLTI